MAAPNDRRNGSIRRRLRPRFRLRTVFVLVTLVCVWLSISMERKYREERALRVITAAGGGSAMRYSWFYPFRSVNIVSFGGEEFTDAKLAKVAEALAALPSLEYLQIVQTSVTDAGLVHLGGLDDVRTLELWGTPITDAGIAHLLEMHNLRHLDVSATLVSNEGASRLAGLHHLERLDLPPSTGVAPRPRPATLAVDELGALLRESYSSPGIVSQSAIRELRRRLPGCSIRQGDGYIPPPTSSIVPNPLPYELR